MNRLLTVIAFVISNFIPPEINAQVWYFGQNQSIDFSADSPEVSYGESALFTKNGCAMQNDPETGEVLFYTDGMTIYDATGTPMPQAYFKEFSEDYHSVVSQGAVTFPMPGSDSLYVVVGCGTGGLQGRDDDPWYFDNRNKLRYWIVDMTKRGGRGGVIERNVIEFDGDPDIDQGIDATFNCNDRSVWVVCRELHKQVFYLAEFTEEGINKTHRFSNADDSRVFTSPTYIEISPNAKHMVLTAPNDERATIHVYNLDLEAENELDLITYHSRMEPISLVDKIYATQFSPNSEFLYFTARDFQGPLVLYQHNFRRALDFSNSTYAYSLNEDFRLRPALQMVNDSMIVVGGTTGLGLISEPNKPKDSCSYIPGYFANNSGSAVDLSLPSLINASLVTRPNDPCPYPIPNFSIDTSICAGNSIVPIDSSEFVQEWKWILSGPDADTLFGASPGEIWLDIPGAYTLTLFASFEQFTEATTRNITVREVKTFKAHVSDTIFACEGEQVHVTPLVDTLDHNSLTWSGNVEIIGDPKQDELLVRATTGFLELYSEGTNQCPYRDTVFIEAKEKTAGTLYLNSFKTDRWTPKKLYLIAIFNGLEGEFSDEEFTIQLQFDNRELFYTGASSFDWLQEQTNEDSTTLVIKTHLPTQSMTDTIGFVEIRANTKEFGLSGVKIRDVTGGDPCLHVPPNHRGHSNITIQDVTSVKDNTSDQSFAVTPNVGRLEDMRLTMSQPQSAHQVHVYDMLGRVRTVNLLPGELEYTLSEMFGSLGRGQYILRIGTETVFFVIEAE